MLGRSQDHDSFEPGLVYCEALGILAAKVSSSVNGTLESFPLFFLNGELFVIPPPLFFLRGRSEVEGGDCLGAEHFPYRLHSILSRKEARRGLRQVRGRFTLCGLFRDTLRTFQSRFFLSWHIEYFFFLSPRILFLPLEWLLA